MMRSRHSEREHWQGKDAPLNANELLAMVKTKFSGSAFAFFANVSDGTGSASSRLADGIAVSLWPSRGLDIQGFELKVARGDWLRELKHPEKAEAVCRYCDRWWVVAGDKEIVKDGELPPTWGLMYATGSGLRIAVNAPVLSPVPLDRCFVAAIARRAVEQAAAIGELKAARKEGYERGKADRSYEVEQLQKLKERVSEFTKASGICLDNSEYRSKFAWHEPAKIGAAVLAALGETERMVSDIQNIKHTAENIARLADECLGKKAEAA